jgi:phage shock protein A
LKYSNSKQLIKHKNINHMGLTDLISRVGKIFEADSNAALDKAEDPAMMTRQAVKDLKDKLQKALDAEVHLKALVIDKRTNAEKNKAAADDWGHKAEQILDKVDHKQISEADGDRLAKEALAQQASAQQAADHYAKEAADQQAILDGMDKKVKELHDMIDQAQNEAEELAAREESAEATTSISKELSSIGGPDSTKDLLDRMRHKTEESEHIAQAYTELDNANKSTKDEINALLGPSSSAGSEDALAALKAKRAAKTDTNA